VQNVSAQFIVFGSSLHMFSYMKTLNTILGNSMPAAADNNFHFH